MSYTALQKAGNEQQRQMRQIQRLEHSIAQHAIIPMNKSMVNMYLTEITTLKHAVIITDEKIHLYNPTEPDPYEITFTDALNRLDKMSFDLFEIKESFPTTGLTTAIKTNSTTGTTEVKLPRIELPKFSGELNDWMAFKDMFLASVHQNAKISDAQKLTYLRATVIGKAAELIKNIPCTDTNYLIAWELLENRFQNDRELVFAILKRLTGQPVIHGDSSPALRSLVDITKECIRSLEILGLSVKTWDPIVVFLLIQKLDSSSKQYWELSLDNTSVPVLEELLQFLEQRARALATGGSSKINDKTHQSPHRSESKKKSAFTHHAQDNQPCISCSGSHQVFRCPIFIAMKIRDRQEDIKKHSACFNCLRIGHQVRRCPSNKLCQVCKKKHHTLLHMDAVPAETKTSIDNPQPVISGHSSDETQIKQTMLATAVVKVFDCHGQPQLCRALLDGGSTASFVREACVRRLGLKRQKLSTQVHGLASAPIGTAKGVTKLNFCAHFCSAAEQSYSVSSLIMTKVTSHLPIQACDPKVWPHIQGLQLADPTFHEPEEVDILLGSDIFWYLLMDGRRIGAQNEPIAVKSTLGWLICGNLNEVSNKIIVNMVDMDLDAALKKFWELETVPETRLLSKEERQCEEHFETTYSRQDDGRYVVSLPFKPDGPNLGSSRDIAIRRLQQLEKRLSSQPNHRKEYEDFMKEYISLGHAEKIPEAEIQNPVNQTCYIPHHFVLKDDSTTTKFRVVFDASATTSAGISLNSNLMVGPKLQDDLIAILTRFRTHPIAFTADIAKMFRQVWINRVDTDYQRIVWRQNPNEAIQDYRLLTVTYGTAPAPFQATRVLQQLARDEESSLPLASKIALRDFYMDDLMSGAETKESALQAQAELLDLCKRGGFVLRKWSSNQIELLNSLPEELRETQIPLRIDMDDATKTLGLNWRPATDDFKFKVNLKQKSLVLTKRTLLSEMSKVFDPLGWLAPAIIRAKIIFQQLWKLDIGWDELLPTNVRKEWEEFRGNLHQIEYLKIPRCIVGSHTTHLHLLGFCDASEKAYAAVTYIRADQSVGDPLISLVSAKTRVAPTKIISLPRLELCGALLLAHLMTSVQESLKLKFDFIHAWTDSTVVLAWLHAHSSRWKTFVANRVTQIQDQVPAECWSHVSGVENPADCASRGIDPSDLTHHSLWWHGPTWLRAELKSKTHNESWSNLDDVTKEEKRIVITAHLKTDDLKLIYQFSALTKLKRVTAWWLRFITNLKSTVHKRKEPHNSYKFLTGPLSPREIDAALMIWVKKVQQEEFQSEIKCLLSNKPVPGKSRIISLNPHLDSTGLLRVGGRLRHAPITLDKREPILLPRHHRLTELIIVSEHLVQLHAGSQLLLSVINRRFWIIGGRDAIRYQVKKCVVCTRHKTQTAQQYMGDLPALRVTPARAFLHCGVDYAGPFLVKPIPNRSKLTIKAYLSLFICFSTKAVHLEVVSSLTTEAFLAALRRFIARRGRCSHIHSDCGTNLGGAANEMKELASLLRSEDHNHRISNQLSNNGIQWHFNPPGAPHFGGLWEAGVKSVKHHLRRIIGSTRLTFEELTTVMTQIEACLNSRHLTPVSSDPNDLSVLTPGHLLIGDSLTSIPESDLTEVKLNRLSRWQATQQMYQHFWRRWSSEYLARLQQRPKWLKHREEIKLNDMVLLKDDRLPPLKWRLGRVIDTHPGPDGVTRVLTLKTAEGDIKRPIVKVCLLPIDYVDTTDK